MILRHLSERSDAGEAVFSSGEGRRSIPGIDRGWGMPAEFTVTGERSSLSCEFIVSGVSMPMVKSIYEAGPSEYVWDARVDIQSELSAEEAARVLDEFVGDAFSSDRLSREMLVGYVRHGKLVVSRARPSIQNAFKPVLRARIEATDEGCRIQGRYTLSRLVAVFMVFWFAFLGMVGTIVGVLWLGGETGAGSIPVFGAVGGLGVIGVLVVWIGMYVGRADIDVIEERIRGELNARASE